MSFAKRTADRLLLGALVAASLAGPAAAQPLFWGALSVSAAPAQPAADAWIRVSVTNTSRQTHSFDAQPMCRLSDLVVTDSRGMLQVPGEKCAAPVPPNEVGFVVPPVRLPSDGIWYGPPLNARPDGAEPLSFWGYRLLPGTYTIYALPTPALWPGQAFAKDSGTANAITITLR